MDTSGWERAKDLFHEAVKCSGREREALLEGVPSEVRDEVLALLAAHEEAGTEATSSSVEGEGPGTVIGRYKLLQEIGEGGFGVVYMAEQTEPVQRKVALKIIKLGMDTKQVVARFEAERQALALMDHPNIAKVLDGGATKQGRPYFVMELVKGIPITEYCDQASLSTGERLDLFTSVCHAIQHAHQKGIIHRDLKPSNVLVTLHEGRPVPKVIDFGIAKATDRRLTEKTLFTEYRQIIGTPEYMAPEQAEMTSLDVDTRADIYSLGVLLYELLTGTKPFDMKDLLEQGYGEILRTIREVDPPRPSTRLSTLGDQLPTIAKQRHTQPKLLGKLIRGDLDWIVMKALEKDRGRRYDTATALADDIGRALLDEPVLAGPPTRSYRLRKYLKRHRVGVATAAAILLALIGGLVVSVAAMREAEHQADLARAAETDAASQRDAATMARAEEETQRLRAEAGEAEAKREAKRASTALDLVRNALGKADPHVTKRPSYTVRELLDDIGRNLSTTMAGQPETEALIRRTMGVAYIGLGLPDMAEPHLKRTLALHRERFGDEHAQTLVSLSQWGFLLHEKGRYRESADVAREAHAAVCRVHGANSPEALGTRYNLAERLGHLHQLEEAEALLREAREWAGKPPADMPWIPTKVVIELSRLLLQKGRLEEAEQLAREAVASASRLPVEMLGIEGRARSQLILVLRERGAFDEALDLSRKDVDSLRDALGPRHPNTLSGMCRLAEVFTAIGHFGEAEKLYAVAVPAIRDVAPDLPTLPYVLSGYAHVLHRLARTDEAEAMDEEAGRRASATFGEHHPMYGAYLSNRAFSLHQRGQFDEADDAYRKALENLEKSSGRRSRAFATALMNLGILEADRGSLEAAETLLREGYESLRSRLGEDHASTAGARNNLAATLMKRGKLQEALDLNRAGIDVLERKTPDHVSLAVAYNNLGELYRVLGRYKEAEEALKKSLAMREGAEGSLEVDRVLSLANLGLLYGLRGRYEEARTHLDEAIALTKKHHGDDHPLLMQLLANLGQLEEACGNTQAAETCFREVLRLGALQPEQQKQARAQVLAALGDLLWQRGAWKEGEDYLREGLALAVDVFGEDGFLSLQTRVQLANLLRVRGQPAEAYELLKDQLELEARTQGLDPTTRVMILNILALAERDLGLLDDALRHAAEAVMEAKKRDLGPQQTGAVLGNKAWILVASSRYEDALSAFQEAVELGKRHGTLAPPEMAALRFGQGTCLAALERHEEAVDPLRDAATFFTENMPAEHPWRSSALATLGWALESSGHHAEAEAPLRAALGARKRLWHDHFLTWNTMSLLGGALAGQGKHEEAEPLLVEGYEKLVAPDNPIWKARKAKALQRIVDLYEAWGKPDEAAKWRAVAESGAEVAAPESEEEPAEDAEPVGAE